MDRYLLKQVIQSNDKLLLELKEVVDIDSTNKKIEDLTTLSLKEDFWLDQVKAKNIIDETNELKDRLSNLKRLCDLEDTLSLIYDMSSEDNDSLNDADSIKEEFDSLYESFQNELLLDKKEDRLNAIVEIHSGAGGTESLDFV